MCKTVVFYGQTTKDFLCFSIGPPRRYLLLLKKAVCNELYHIAQK